VAYTSSHESRKAIRARQREEARRAGPAREFLDRVPKVDMMLVGPDRIPQRRYLLFGGPIDAVIPLKIGGGWSRSPNHWWPDDRAWIVVSEIDAPCTYVGGSAPLVEALLSEPGLEVVPSDLGQRFDGLGDTINPDEIPDLQE